MPFKDPDLWDRRLYANVDPCPDVIIPVDDTEGWILNPDYRWVYNKLALSELQGLKCGPHGTWDDRFWVGHTFQWPVFSKPICNLWGNSIGIEILENLQDAESKYAGGHFWMEILEGEVSSIDLVIINGTIVWSSYYQAISIPPGAFDYWFTAMMPPRIERQRNLFVDRYLDDYTGVFNFEFKGEKIIECHLRMPPQFTAVYGDDFLRALIELYRNGNFDWYEEVEGYSVALYIEDSIKPIIDWDLVKEIQAEEGSEIDNFTVTMYSDGTPEQTKPPGRTRVCLIQTKNLQAGLKYRDMFHQSIKNANEELSGI
ncbi:hypothetical protein LCGC14_0944840 [marine sediment metagenome]|uniref:Uncharacterized protein n=1 Tax=marine sediment metagenome TaxID=412755 RepID=A0A0F9NNQ2_9ZZZZ